MRGTTSSDRGHRFPAEIISQAVWLYYRFNLSFRDVEDLLAERGIKVSHETVRRWSQKFGPKYAHRLKTKERPGAIRANIGGSFKVNIDKRQATRLPQPLVFF